MALDILPPDLPWHLSAALILDGVSLSGLPKKLYEWSDQPAFEQLYLETKQAPLADISPCLVAVKGPEDPVLHEFLSLTSEDCGYLLFSEASWEQQVDHMRWLTQVRAPSGEIVLLRRADPAVLSTLLLTTAKDQSSEITGPFERLVLPDAMKNDWLVFQPTKRLTQPSRKDLYQLSDLQLTALGDVSFQQVVVRLDRHLQMKFPAYGSEWPSGSRRTALTQLADEAYSRGFCSEGDIQLYSGIFGLLGENALEAHRDINHLLDARSSETPSQRLRRAFDKAQGRAAIHTGIGHV